MGMPSEQPTQNEGLASPFQPGGYDMSAMMPEPYEDQYYHEQPLMKSKGSWLSEDRNFQLSTSMGKSSSSETTPVTPSYNYDSHSQCYYDSVSSFRLPNSSSSSVSSKANRKIIKPLVATVFWEEEDTICYQVKANGFVVSRKEKDNLVNGTKLLNVTGMSRGRRDGILKVEKGRKVIRNGSMNLKGVWIPFHRALEIARNEGVKDLLYPLFVNDIGKFYKEEGQKLYEELDDEGHRSEQ
uniref:HTH APSES-type domain-containing protein n=1 Tax=Candidozyma auris TaxID=498019 RepID=A0A0L0NNC6_CANAR